MSQAFVDLAERCLTDGRFLVHLKRQGDEWVSESDNPVVRSFGATLCDEDPQELRRRYHLEHAENRVSEREEAPVLPLEQIEVSLTHNKTSLLLVLEDEQSQGRALELSLNLAAHVEADILLFWKLACADQFYLDLNLAEGAKLTLGLYTEADCLRLPSLFVRTQQAKDSEFRALQTVLGASYEAFWRLDQREEGARSELYFANFANVGSRQDLEVELYHHAKHSYARMQSQSVLTAGSWGRFIGRDIILPGASDADSYQKSDMLLLDPSARAESRPIMIIDNHDLKAGHASTIGALDKELLYYLQSRGLERESAEILLTEAALRKQFEAFPFEGLVEHLMARLDERLREEA